MLDETSIALLKRILVASTSSFRGIEALKFRADHCSHLDLLDRLQGDRYVEVREGRYYLRLSALKYIADETPQVGSLIYLCEHLFQTLQRRYQQSPGEPIDIDTLAEQADLPKRQIATGIAYMTEAAILEKWGRDSDGMYTSITPAERILRYKTFEKVIEAQQREFVESLKHAEKKAALRNNTALRTTGRLDFVDESRIIELKSLTNKRFDLGRVVRLCEELNSSLGSGNFFAIAFLVRAILDHIPPVFGCGNFAEVANNYATKSMKKSFDSLDSSVRNISDSLLHQQIRTTEPLPNLVTVNSSKELDVLLGEVVRVLREN